MKVNTEIIWHILTITLHIIALYKFLKNHAKVVKNIVWCQWSSIIFYIFTGHILIPFQIEKGEGGLTCPSGECFCQDVFNGKLVGDVICCTKKGSALPPNDDESIAEKVSQCPSNQQCLAICFDNYPGVTNYCCSTITTRTTTPPPPPGPSCFPSTARVNLQNGKSVAMSELQIGDHVQAGKQHFYFIIRFFCYAAGAMPKPFTIWWNSKRYI